MRSFSMLALFVTAAPTFAQTPPLDLGGYKTQYGAAIVTFTTNDRAAFYELLARIGQTDQFEYSVEWKPAYRMAVYFMPERGASPDLLQSTGKVLEALNLAANATIGASHVQFQGAQRLPHAPMAVLSEGNVTLPPTKDLPTLIAFAVVAEAMVRSYSVSKVASEAIPNLALEGADAEGFLDFLARAARVDLKRGKNNFELSKKTAG